MYHIMRVIYGTLGLLDGSAAPNGKRFAEEDDENGSTGSHHILFFTRLSVVGELSLYPGYSHT